MEYMEFEHLAKLSPEEMRAFLDIFKIERNDITPEDFEHFFPDLYDDDIANIIKIIELITKARPEE